MKSDSNFFAFTIIGFALIISACNQAPTSRNNVLEDTLITSFDRGSITGSSITDETEKPAVNFDKSNMVRIPTGTIRSVPDKFLNAQPFHEIKVEGFWLDEHEVTNAEFALFVEATGYQTNAERALDPIDFPAVPLDMLVPGSFVFRPRTGIEKVNHKEEEIFVAGANWRHPTGSSSTIKGKEKDPVVQISYEDAVTYAKWIGKRLPTVEELEYATQGGYFVYGDQLNKYHLFGSGGKDKMAHANNKTGFLCVGDAME